MGYNQAFGYWPQSTQSVQESQVELVQHRLQNTKSQRNSAWCSANRYNLPSLGANREFKTENIVQAYPVVVDTFNYK